MAIPRIRLLLAARAKRALVTLLTERVDDELLDAAGEQPPSLVNQEVWESRREAG